MIKLSKNLILGSNSPRRKQIMADAGFEFEVLVRETDESFSDTMPIVEVAPYLAEKKANRFLNDIGDNIVLTADTIVAIDNEILNKPADFAEAKAMLKKLSGRNHFVHTGVCILSAANKKNFVDTTEVYFKDLSNAEIEYYINTCKPFDKAGAYGVQDFIGMVGIDKIEGSYFTVMGLPIHRVYNELAEFMEYQL
jgi:septum formation protein